MNRKKEKKIGVSQAETVRSPGRDCRLFSYNVLHIAAMSDMAGSAERRICTREDAIKKKCLLYTVNNARSQRRHLYDIYICKLTIAFNLFFDEELVHFYFSFCLWAITFLVHDVTPEYEARQRLAAGHGGNERQQLVKPHLPAQQQHLVFPSRWVSMSCRTHESTQLNVGGNCLITLCVALTHFPSNCATGTVCSFKEK